MMKTDWTSLRVYAIAVAVVATGLLLRLAFWGLLGSSLPFLFFWPALVIAAWYGGLRAGLLTTILAALAETYFVIEPRFSFSVADPINQVRVVHFVVMGGLISLLGEELDRSIRRAARMEFEAAERERLRTTLASIGDAVLVTDAMGRVYFLNGAAESLLGWPQAAAVGRPLAEVFRLVVDSTGTPSDDPLRLVMGRRTAPALAKYLELIGARGRRVLIDPSAAPIHDRNGNSLGVVLTVREVGPRLREQRETAAALALLETVQKNAPVGLALVDAEFRYLRVNDYLAALHGIPVAEHLGHTVQEVLPRFWPRAERVFRRVLETGQPLLDLVLNGEASGRPELDRHCLASYYPVDLGGGNRGIGIVVTDVSHLKMAQERLRESERFARQLAEVSPAVLFVYDLDRKSVVYLNRDTLHWLGYTTTALMALGPTAIAELMHLDDQARYPALQERIAVLADGQTESFDFRLRLADGSWRWFASFNRVFRRDDSGRPTQVIGAALDITQRRHTELMLDLQKNILGRIVEGRPLDEILHALNAAVESLWPGLLCSVLLLDADGTHLHCSAAASLPAEYNAAVEGLAIGPAVGSCGAAAYRKEMVIVTDIAADPLWEEGRDLALRHNLGACWSMPILSRGGTVLGTFGVYARKPMSPDERHLEGLRAAAYLAAVAIERRRAEDALSESERIFREMAETVPDIIFTTRPDGSTDYVNSRLYEVTGLPAGSALGNGWTAAVQPTDLIAVKAEWEAALVDGTPFESHYRLRTPTGSYRWFVSRARPIRDEAGRVVRWFGTVTDIHDLWMAEEALQSAAREKDLFLTVLAHELRNPLAPIQSAVETLRLTAGEPGRLERALQVIDQQVASMRLLLDDLFDVSRITQGKIQLRREALTLADLLDRAVAVSRPLIDARHHSLTVDLPPQPVWLHADPMRLTQVVSNLLNNAAKYTDPGGEIRVSAVATDSEVELRIADNGIGIAAEMLPRVFDLFTQADTSMDRAQGGLGIGLTVVRRLVELHGGTVTAMSEGAGRGSTFVVRLPVQTEVEKETSRSQPAPPKMKRQSRRILVVDDCPEFAEGWGLLLGVSGHEVRCVHDGPAALEAARSFRPEVVSLDLGMRGMNGCDVVRLLRQQPGLDKALVVAISGYTDAAIRDRALEAGCDAVLPKPVKTEDFLKLLAGRANLPPDEPRP